MLVSGRVTKIVQIAIFEKKITLQNIMFGFNVRFSRCVFYSICRYAYRYTMDIFNTSKYIHALFHCKHDY